MPEITPIQHTGLLGLLTALFWCGYSVFKYLDTRRKGDSNVKIKTNEEAFPETKIKIQGNVLMETTNPSAPIGVQETKEALIALNEIALFVIEHKKSSLQQDISDLATALLASSDFKLKIEVAFKNLNQVPAEIKDIDISEGFELAKTEYDYAQKIIAAIKA